MITAASPNAWTGCAGTDETGDLCGFSGFICVSPLDFSGNHAILRIRKQAELAPNKNDYEGREALMVTIVCWSALFPLLLFFCTFFSVREIFLQKKASFSPDRFALRENRAILLNSERCVLKFTMNHNNEVFK